MLVILMRDNNDIHAGITGLLSEKEGGISIVLRQGNGLMPQRTARGGEHYLQGGTETDIGIWWGRPQGYRREGAVTAKN